jgi:hypothetical protein
MSGDKLIRVGRRPTRVAGDAAVAAGCIGLLAFVSFRGQCRLEDGPRRS